MKLNMKISAVLLISLIIQCFGTVWTSASYEGWKINYVGEDNTDRTRWCAEIIYNHKYDGNAAMMVKYPGSQKNENVYCEIKNNISAMESGNYTLSFYNKGTASIYTEICVGNKVFGYADMESESVTAPSGDGTWKKYSVTFDYEEQQENYIAFKFYAGTPGTAIDDVSIVKTGETENRVSDSSFELFEESDDENEYDTKDYQITRLQVTPAAGKLALSWVNPAVTELTAVNIYNITDGKNELIASNIDSTPSKLIVHSIEGLANGQNYMYKIVFSFRTKADYNYFVCGTPAADKNRSLGGWDLYKAVGDVGFCPGRVQIDRNEAYEGKASLKFASNIDRSQTIFQSKIYMAACSAITSMEKGKKYRIGFWVKGKNVLRAPQMHMSWVNFDGVTPPLFEDLTGTYDWKHCEYDYTYDSKNIIYIILDGEAEGLWYDNLTCYELDENGEPTGDNLMQSGDFENLISDDVAEIKNLTATPGSGSVDLAWEAFGGSYAGANLYQLVFGKYEYRGTVGSETSSMHLPGLIKDKEYEFKIVPFNDAGLEGDGQSVSTKTLLPDYEFGDAVLMKNDVAVSSVNGAGSYKVILPAKNNTINDGFIFEQIVAVYKDNILTGVYSTQKNLTKSKKSAELSKISTEFDIEDDSAYRIEFHVIDSRDKLNVLKTYTVFE